jgi:isoleucyl-tRNA synthetase
VPTFCGSGSARRTTTDDLRIGPEILKTTAESYRKLRNSIRWMLGALAHHDPSQDIDLANARLLERYVLHRLAELDSRNPEGLRGLRLPPGRSPGTCRAFMNADLVGGVLRRAQGHALLRTAVVGEASRGAQVTRQGVSIA